MNKLNDFCVFLDAGHGGIGPNGRYTTAPDKMYHHGRMHCDFHYEGRFYEGVWNRHLTSRVMFKLRNMQIPFYIVSHKYIDTALEERVGTANRLSRHYRHSIYLSNHSNAGGGSGYEHYTSPGNTMSDQLGEIYWHEVERMLGDSIRYRPDLSDGDHDKEARFFVLTRTMMPALLIEHLFFDNYKDAMLLMDEDIVERFAEAQVHAILKYYATL